MLQVPVNAKSCESGSGNLLFYAPNNKIFLKGSDLVIMATVKLNPNIAHVACEKAGMKVRAPSSLC